MRVIYFLKNDKSLGISGVSVELFKCFEKDVVCEIILCGKNSVY